MQPNFLNTPANVIATHSVLLTASMKYQRRKVRKSTPGTRGTIFASIFNRITFYKVSNPIQNGQTAS